MNAKAFLVDALSSALDLGLVSGDDVLRHITPEVLAAHLPRPLWARLLTACVGASRVDPQLVLETVGVPNLCEHVPSAIVWGCVAEAGARALGLAAPPQAAWSTPALLAPTPSGALLAPAPAAALLAPVTASPSLPTAVGPAIPAPAVNAQLADLVAEMDADERPVPPPARPRTPTSGQRFRPSNTGSGFGRPATNGGATSPRRPQAAATTAASVAEAGTARARRPATEVSDYDIETDVRLGDDWKVTTAPAIDVDVEDEQLVDWSASEETVAGGDALSPRKR